MRERHQTFNVDSKKRRGQQADAKGASGHTTAKSSSHGNAKGELHSMKHNRLELNADADQKTQLVHLNNTVTNEGKINLAKV